MERTVDGIGNIRLAVAPGFRGPDGTEDGTAFLRGVLRACPHAAGALDALGVRLVFADPQSARMVHRELFCAPGTDSGITDTTLGQVDAFGSIHGPCMMTLVGSGRPGAWMPNRHGSLEVTLNHETTHLLHDHLDPDDLNLVLETARHDAERFNRAIETEGAAFARICGDRAPLRILRHLASPAFATGRTRDVADHGEAGIWQTPAGRSAWQWGISFYTATLGTLADETGMGFRGNSGYWRYSFTLSRSWRAVAAFETSPPPDPAAQQAFAMSVRHLRDEVVAHFVDGTLEAADAGLPVARDRVELARSILGNGAARARSFRASSPRVFHRVAEQVRAMAAEAGVLSPLLEVSCALHAMRQELPAADLSAASQHFDRLARMAGNMLGAGLYRSLVQALGIQDAVGILNAASAHFERWMAAGQSTMPLAPDENAETVTLLAGLPCLPHVLEAAHAEHCRIAGHWQRWLLAPGAGERFQGRLRFLSSALTAGPPPDRAAVAAAVNARAAAGQPEPTPLETAVLAFQDPAMEAANGLLPVAAAQVQDLRDAMLTRMADNGVGSVVTAVRNASALLALLRHPDAAFLETDFMVRTRWSLGMIDHATSSAMALDAAMHRPVCPHQEATVSPTPETGEDRIPAPGP